MNALNHEYATPELTAGNYSDMVLTMHTDSFSEYAMNQGQLPTPEAWLIVKGITNWIFAQKEA